MFHVSTCERGPSAIRIRRPIQHAVLFLLADVMFTFIRDPSGRRLLVRELTDDAISPRILPLAASCDPVSGVSQCPLADDDDDADC